MRLPAAFARQTLTETRQNRARNAQELAGLGRDSAGAPIGRDNKEETGSLAGPEGSTGETMSQPQTQPPDWTNPSDYASLIAMDRPGFAWELLRRNPLYREGSAALPVPGDGSVIAISDDAVRIAACWGLDFPGGR
jgi:hypothetical protein